MKAKQPTIRFMSKYYTQHFVVVLMLSMSNLTLAAGNDISNVSFSPPTVFIGVDLNRDGKIKRDGNQPRVDKNGKIIDTVEAKDKTTPELPYRFWVNNDLDVVNASDVIRYDLISCGNLNGSYTQEYQQTCEQWDEDTNQPGGTRTNTSPTAMLNRIESYRDLEDFAPLLISIIKKINLEDYSIKLKAVGVSVNIFKSNWDDSGTHVAHEYIFDTQKTIEQIELANSDKGHFATVLAGDEVKITNQEIDEYFDADTGEGKFIFEATAPSQEGCASNAENCYLELEVSSKKDETFNKQTSRVYMDIHDIKDFYVHVTAGSAQTTGNWYQPADEFTDYDVPIQNAFHAEYNGGYIQKKSRVLDIYQGVLAPSEISKDLVVFVHGWRMLDAEKINFAETSYKRLYWSGYKSQFATFTWPTGWFKKPASAYGAGVLPYVLGNELNYDVSELVARKVGVDFRNWLVNTPSSGAHVIAHSMGNVVVSEALKYNGTGNLITSYSATLAATAAGSYDSAAIDMQHELEVYPEKILGISLPTCTASNVEEAWRCYNIDNELSLDDTAYDMPPDMYRNHLLEDDGQGNLIVKHGETTAAAMGPNATGNHHFKGISSHAQRILNFYNTVAEALTAWEFNQLTKPDVAQGINWFYTNSYRKAYADYEICLLQSADEPDPSCASLKPSATELDGEGNTVPVKVVAEFQEGGVVVPYNEQNIFKILAHSIPARTEPLGQQKVTTGEITNSPEMTGFTSSNQDHSAPFHGYYSEETPKSTSKTPRQRAAYRNTVLKDSIKLNPLSGDYTGLRNNIVNVEQ